MYRKHYMNTYDSQRSKRSSARERQAARYQRRDGTTRFRVPMTSSRALPLAVVGASLPWLRRAAVIVRDVWWYAIHKTPLGKVVAVLAVVLFGLFVANHVFTGRIFPNVWALGVHLGDLSVEDAGASLQNAWQARTTIALQIDGQTVATLHPEDLGLQLDAEKTAEFARGVGLSGIPFGYGVTPVVGVDELKAQNALLDAMPKVDIRPYNAGYTWQDGQLVGVHGRDGRTLDVSLTLQQIKQDPAGIVTRGKLDLLMSAVPPDVVDPAPYLDDARALVSHPITLTGYDPFANRTVAWTTTPQEFTNWLEAGVNTLTLREDAFQPYIHSLNATLNKGQDDLRYLDPKETMDQVRNAIINKQTNVALRIRYRPTKYQIQAGDTGQAIARKTGIPFLLIQDANPGRDWNMLSIGSSIDLPSRDIALPDMPVPNKRIVVNLDNQSLSAFDNGQLIFNWKVSSGIDQAPTYPGIFQILTHNDTALGSSYTLCSEGGLNCGQWTMYWFMGVYEIRPGLMNGFHGAVLLPNGAYLGGGNVGAPYTFGCIMSENSNAKKLYDWADNGTVVEIISHDFKPESDLAQYALQHQL
jgi:LysM repeat protein